MAEMSTDVESIAGPRQLVSLDSLHTAPWNPREIKKPRFQNLCRSLAADPAFLWNRPVCAMANGEIYAGNMRYVAVRYLWENGIPGVNWKEMAQAAGIEPGTIPAIVEDVPEDVARERAIRDNAQWGVWDEELLAEQVYHMAQNGSDIKLIGLTDEELADLAKLIGTDGETTLPGEDPGANPVPTTPVTQPGDLWYMGDHRLICGDATDEHTVTKLMVDAQASVLWTDPPYGVEYVGKTKDALTIKGDQAAGIRTVVEAALRNAQKVLRPSSPFYLCHPPGAQHILFWLAVEAVGWRPHEELIWQKDSMVLGHMDYHLKHEPILYGWTPGPGRPGRGAQEGTRWYGDNSQTSLLVFDRPTQSVDHPTMKPVELIVYCLSNSSRKSEGVLDLFGGSGSTIIAAENCGRVAYLCEIDPGYCDVTIDRWARMTGKEPVRSDGVKWSDLCEQAKIPQES